MFENACEFGLIAFGSIFIRSYICMYSSFWLKLSRYWDFNRIPRSFFSSSYSYFSFAWVPAFMTFDICHGVRSTFYSHYRIAHFAPKQNASMVSIEEKKKKYICFNKTYRRKDEKQDDEKNVERPITRKKR